MTEPPSSSSSLVSLDRKDSSTFTPTQSISATPQPFPVPMVPLYATATPMPQSLMMFPALSSLFPAPTPSSSSSSTTSSLPSSLVGAHYPTHLATTTTTNTTSSSRVSAFPPPMPQYGTIGYYGVPQFHQGFVPAFSSPAPPPSTSSSSSSSSSSAPNVTTSAPSPSSALSAGSLQPRVMFPYTSVFADVPLPHQVLPTHPVSSSTAPTASPSTLPALAAPGGNPFCDSPAVTFYHQPLQQLFSPFDTDLRIHLPLPGSRPASPTSPVSTSFSSSSLSSPTHSSSPSPLYATPEEALKKRKSPAEAATGRTNNNEKQPKKMRKSSSELASPATSVKSVVLEVDEDKIVNAARPPKSRTTLGEILDSGLDMIFPCPISGCGAKFSRREHLKRHMRSHTGEKPYTCGVCGKIFTRSDNMNQHKLTHRVNADDMQKRYRRKPRSKAFKMAERLAAAAAATASSTSTATAPLLLAASSLVSVGSYPRPEGHEGEDDNNDDIVSDSEGEEGQEEDGGEELEQPRRHESSRCS